MLYTNLMNTEKRKKQLVLAACLSGVLFLIMTLLGANHLFAIFDHAASSVLVSIRIESLTRMLVLLTEIINIPFMVIFITGITSVLMWSEKKMAFRFAFTLVLGLILFSVIKIAIHESRPVDGLIDVSGFSYPSGHATMATILFVFLAELFERISKKPLLNLLFNLAALCMIIIVSMSRIYLGVHWLSDVLAGMLLGVFTTSVVALIFLRFPSLQSARTT